MPKRLIIAISIAFVLIFGYFFVLPTYREFKSVKFEIAKKEEEIAQKEKYFSYLRELSDKLKGYKNELANVDFALPSSAGLPDLLNFIQKTAKENGLIFTKITGFQILPKQTDRHSRDIKLSLNLSGSYASLKNFLRVLEENSRLVKVENLSFSTPENKKDIFEFQIEIKSQYFSP